MNHSYLFTCASSHWALKILCKLPWRDLSHYFFGLLEFCQILCSTCWVMCCIISFLLCCILFHWSHTLYAMVNASSGPHSACYQPPRKTHSQCSPVAWASVVYHKKKNYWHLSNFLITSQCMRSGFLISLACITPDFTRQTSWFYLPHSSSTVVLIFIFYKGVELEFEPLSSYQKPGNATELQDSWLHLPWFSSNGSHSFTVWAFSSIACRFHAQTNPTCTFDHE